MPNSKESTNELAFDGAFKKASLLRDFLKKIRNMEDTEDMDECVEKFCQDFRQDEIDIDALLEEEKLCLWYFTGQPETHKTANRCLLFFVKCSLKMISEDAAIPPFFTVLLQHIKNIQFAVYDASRYRCCLLITLLLKETEEIESEFEPTECGEERILTTNVLKCLTKILKNRIYDKSPAVRAEVLRSLSVLNRISENIADELQLDCNKQIVKSLQDISSDVRTAAVRYAPLLTEDNISAFILAVCTESNENVRRLGYSRIACNLHVRSLTVEQRMQLLRTGLATDDVVLRKIMERMLVSWVGEDGVPLLNLVEQLDFLSDPGTTQQTLTMFLKRYQQQSKYSRTSEMVKNIREMCSAVQTAISENRQFTLLNSSILDKRNYASSCRRGNLYQVAGLIFTWRTLCEHCRMHAVDESDRCESLHILLPDLVEFVEFLYEVLTNWASTENSTQGMFEEFIVYELCLLTRSFDQTDKVGMERWRDLLETIISTRELPNSGKILHFAVCELYKLFYQEDEKLKEFIEWCCYRLNSFLTPDLNETEELPIIKALLEKRRMNCITSSVSANEDSKDELARHGMKRALLFLHAVMQTFCNTKMTTFLRAAFDQVVDTYCSSPEPVIWPLLCEVIGTGVLNDTQIARERIHMLRSVIEVDVAPSSVKAVALKFVALSAKMRGLTAVAQLYYQDAKCSDVKKGRMLLRVFEKLVFNEDEKLSHMAVECLIEILCDTCSIFPSALAFLLIRYFDNACQPYPYTSLNTFFNAYTSSSTNQHKLVGALRNALEKLDEAENSEIFAHVDVKKMMNFVASSSKSVSTSAKQNRIRFEGTYSPHFFVISTFLDWVVNHAESALTEACIGALALTVPEEFSHNNKARRYILKMVVRCINVLMSCELDKLIPLVRRFQKRLEQKEGNEDVIQKVNV
ncbi:unnamed protein product [Thelazia callipaeda]|uniref:Cnd3 domain-containing protein n=1 Tax=Thelazia callipaeda TaxID=103827 RepID=A0A0N5DAM2_THECL|nr:unnamed protein product [Thelazia callipaeda]